MKFKSMDVQNFERQKTCQLTCEDCKSTLKCSACNIAFEWEYWTKAERAHTSRPSRQKLLEERNHSSQPKRQASTLLVCKPCRKNGYTPDDVATYSCQTCGTQCGWKLFDPIQIKNCKYRGNKISCKACMTQHAERIKTLKQNLEKSTRKCNLRI